MKISSKQYKQLATLIETRMQRFKQIYGLPTIEAMEAYYTENSIGQDHIKRLRWDLFYMAPRPEMRQWADDTQKEMKDGFLSDNHIDTALKKTIKDLKAKGH